MFVFYATHPTRKGEKMPAYGWTKISPFFHHQGIWMTSFPAI